MSDSENACSMGQPVSTVLLLCPGWGAPVVSSDTGGVGTRAGAGEEGGGGAQVTLATGAGAAVTKLDSIAAQGTGTGATGAADGAREPGSRSRVTIGGGEGDLGSAGTVTGCRLSSVSPEGVTP